MIPTVEAGLDGGALGEQHLERGRKESIGKKISKGVEIIELPCQIDKPNKRRV